MSEKLYFVRSIEKTASNEYNEIMSINYIIIVNCSFESNRLNPQCTLRYIYICTTKRVPICININNFITDINVVRNVTGH